MMIDSDYNLNKNVRIISNVVLSAEISKWENLGSFIESKMSINKSGASRRSTFWQGIEWDTPIKFKTIDLYKALIFGSSLMCENTRQSYTILKDHMEKIMMEIALWEFFSVYCFMAYHEKELFCWFPVQLQSLAEICYYTQPYISSYRLVVTSKNWQSLGKVTFISQVMSFP